MNTQRKIKLTFGAIIVFQMFTQINYAQIVTEQIQKEQPNFYQIRNEFYQDFQNDKPILNSEKNLDGNLEKFKRWEWYWTPRIHTDGTFPSPEKLHEAFHKYQDRFKAQVQERTGSKANWMFFGPNQSEGGYAGIGRVNCIAFHPTNPSIFWVGTPAGGLWKTMDAGDHWTTSTDQLPVLGVADIAVHPTNPNILYIATGDGEGALYTLGGDTKSLGVFKSIDGGNTWNQTGLNWLESDILTISRLIINKSNPNILIAAARNGIWRTMDGGITWTQYFPGQRFMDVEFHPTNPKIVYAATAERSKSGIDAKIFRSLDGGITWTESITIPEARRINLAVSLNNPNEVQALCADTSWAMGGLWSSVDTGKTFTEYFPGDCDFNFLSWSEYGFGCTGQGWYDLAYNINPQDANEFWLGGVNTWTSKDKGNNWSISNLWHQANDPDVDNVHADKHMIVHHPLDPTLVYECNDGGVYMGFNNGEFWADISNGLGISQIYRIGTSATTENNVLCGLQDNGTKELMSTAWYDRTGGDGFESIIDPVDDDVQYSTLYYGLIHRTYDHWLSNDVILGSHDSIGPHSKGAWLTPYVMHPQDRFTLTVGKDQVYQTNDQGNNWYQLGTIDSIHGFIESMAQAESDPETFYVATQKQLFRTFDLGANWQLVDTSNTVITYIAIDPFNNQKVYITKSGYIASDKIWKSTDGGLTWENISGTLPNVPVNCISFEKGTEEGLYIGTDLGVFYKDAKFPDWIPFNEGLPHVVVSELEINYKFKKIWAGTYGRGLWVSDLYSKTSTNENINFGNFKIFPNPVRNTLQLTVPTKSTGNGILSIKNLLGQEILKEEFNASLLTSSSYSMEVNLLSAGTYFLELVTDGRYYAEKFEKL